MNRLPEKIIFGSIGLIIIGWLGFHIFYTYYDPLEIEAVYNYTINQSMTATGIAVREERVIDQSATGIEHYLFDDAERVTIGQPVAEFFSQSGIDRGMKRMREIESEIDMLQKAQDKNINNFANTDTLNRDIREQLTKLTEISSTGDYAKAADIRQNLSSLLNRRQIATGKSDNFNDLISSLQSEYAQLERYTEDQGVVVATAPLSGYFVKSVDGYEQSVTPTVVDKYDIDEFTRLIRSKISAPQSGYVGKIVTNYKWYFAVSLKRYNTENLRKGQLVELDFSSIGETIPAFIVELLIDNTKEDAVAVFECDRFSAGLINLRTDDVTIRFVDYTGLRISAAGIHYVNDERGVFVIEDNIVRFKKINTVFEGQGYVLSKMNIVETPEYDKDYVRLYHQIIVKGTDLYDGKILQ